MQDSDIFGSQPSLADLLASNGQQQAPTAAPTDAIAPASPAAPAPQHQPSSTPQATPAPSFQSLSDLLAANNVRFPSAPFGGAQLPATTEPATTAPVTAMPETSTTQPAPAASSGPTDPGEFYQRWHKSPQPPGLIP